MGDYKWLVFALIGAGFAAIVNVLSKSALKASDVFVALCLQSLLMLTTLLVSVTIMGRWSAARAMPRWAVGLIVLSGIAGGCRGRSGTRRCSCRTWPRRARSTR